MISAPDLPRSVRLPKTNSPSYVVDDEGRPLLRQDDTFVPLGLETEKDHLDDDESRDAARDHPFWDEDANRTTCDDTAETVDHRRTQTSIKNQLDRGTCVCFASLAAIEAVHKADNGTALDLSEQYGYIIHGIRSDLA